ncbi:MAG: acyl-CoA dehydrogenase family protein [Chloroflexi bacterium]|nr:acyl-CoA dehydrogenase family protein [Chloroflexota bacterium]
MDFLLSEQHQMIRNTARELASLEIAPRASNTDEYAQFPWDSLQALAQSGMMGVLLPTTYGGSGADLLSFAIMSEEIAKACANTALIFVTHVAASQGILLGARDSIKDRVLPLLAKGQKLAAFVATEPDSGANVLAIQASAKDAGDAYVVNGSKIFITSAEEAEFYVTVVRTGTTPGPSSLSALLIEKETAGLDTGRRFLRLGMNGTSSGELLFSDCRVPKSNLLGQEGGYMPVGLAMAGTGMVGMAAIALGLAQASLDLSIDYAKSRVVAGQPLGNYQALRFLIGEMSVMVEAIRNTVYGSAVSLAAPSPGWPLAALRAKLFATESALQVIDKALQLHGGTGYTKELPLERYYRDARGLTLHLSPTEVIKDTLGLILLGMMPS